MCLAFCIANYGEAQVLKKLKDKIKTKTDQKTDAKANQDIDKSLDSVLNGKSPFTKKDKPEKEVVDTTGRQNTMAAVTETDNPAREATTTSYLSKFDFIPGEKLLLLDNFSEDAIGDFPSKWYTNGSGEIVTLEGYEGKWLIMSGSAEYYIEQLLQLPENFTIQFDLMCSIPFSWSSGIINFEIKDVAKNADKIYESDLKQKFRMDMHPGIPSVNGNYSTNAYGHYALANQHGNIDLKEYFMPATGKNLLHVSIWRQKQRLRIYLNENKILDLPKILPADMSPNVFAFRTEGFENEDHYFISNLRVAVGNPDTRNKLLTEGKWVTTGILFDVNSDKIKPESYGVMKEIDGILNEDKTLKVKIIGHTDNDGDESKNLELSKRRAAAVKHFLVSDFGIDPNRLETDGKGESEPAVPNTTAENKANNRRVEFIKTN